MSIISKFFLATIAATNIVSAWQTISTTEWAKLSDSMDGTVVLPTDSDYDSELCRNTNNIYFFVVLC